MIKTLLIGVGCGAVALTIGILIGHFGTEKSSGPSWVAQDVDESMIEQFMSEENNVQIREHLWVLTKVPHMATSAGDEQTVEYVLNNWKDPETLDPSDDWLHTNRLKEKAYFEEQNDPDVVQSFGAYSPPGHARGKLVFANRGLVSDYQELNKTLDLRGTIAIRWSRTS